MITCILGFLNLAQFDVDSKETLTKLTNEDKHRYAARILAGSKPGTFGKRVLSGIVRSS
jgi:hypothetical protein